MWPEEDEDDKDNARDQKPRSAGFTRQFTSSAKGRLPLFDDFVYLRGKGPFLCWATPARDAP